MIAASSHSQPTPRPWGFYAVVGTVLVLGLYGAVLTATQRARSPQGDVHGGNQAQQAHPGGQAHRQHELRTSFGTVAVLDVELLGGLRSKDLAGKTHGVQSLVQAGNAQAEVSFAIINRLDRPVAYSPGQFSLRLTRNGKPILPQSSTLKPGMLPAGARIDARLGFVVPASKTRFWLTFDDPARRAPILVDLGRTALSSGTGSGKGSLNYDPLNGAKPGDDDHGHANEKGTAPKP